MPPDAPYHPANHAAGFAKALSAWMLYALLLVVALGLPSLWTGAAQPAKAPLTANLPAPGPAADCASVQAVAPRDARRQHAS